ncbi:MAG: 4-hydroxythreonine-4-phosphate dehydrogenase PdxA [Thalassobaculales bacterium]
MQPSARPPLAVTMGDPAGIGGELTLKLWMARGSDVPVFCAFDDPDRLNALARKLGWSVPILPISDPAEAPAAFQGGLPVLPVPLARPARAGRPDPENARAVVESIRLAVQAAKADAVAAVVTNPIHKSILHQAGFRYPGHTEYLAHLSGPDTFPVMMLASPMLRVVPVTIHVPVAEVPGLLTEELIVLTGRITDIALRTDFGIERPRLAVAGLNPHAGEGGSIGREDAETVRPAIEALRAGGIAASGPHPADTLFHADARAGYDVALCMYHDQALIPIKTLDFWGGVNVTLGLPFIRTSPDHGTAFDLAGRGRANPASLAAALRLAARLAARRAGSA